MLEFMLISFMASEFMFDLLPAEVVGRILTGTGVDGIEVVRGRAGMEVKADGDGWDGNKVCGDGWGWV